MTRSSSVEVLDWARGTSLWPNLADWQDAILFLETSEDAPSPAMVTCILRAFAALGVLKRLSGILFGRPGGGVVAERFGEYDEALLQVVREEEGLPDLPVVHKHGLWSHRPGVHPTTRRTG